VITSIDDIQNCLRETLEQCRRHRLPSELIIVAREIPALRIPPVPGTCAVRIIEVPEDLPLGDEIGTRRARGRYIAANVHGPLPDELMAFIGGQHARFRSLENDDIALNDGCLGLGKGWFWKEVERSKPFRWFNNDAEIGIQPRGDAMRILAIDIEPGPGVNMGPTTLDVLDDAEAKVLSARLVNRRVVNIPLPPNDGMPMRLRLRVSDALQRRSSDSRSLNARVFGCGLYEAPVTAREWTLAQRIGWMLTRSAGSSLLPTAARAVDWTDLAGVKDRREFTILPRAKWLDGKDPDWGFGSQELKETLLVEIVEIAPRRLKAMVAVDLIGMPMVWFFRAVPRPPMPQRGAFDHVTLGKTAPDEPLPALENAPKISVVTPSYQQGHFLEWTMRSVLEQRYPNLEYVVMDGGSTDETGEILVRYKDRLAYYESAPDKGQADAVARGFEHSSGEIMAYLNSDDLLAPGALDFVARFFSAHPEVDAIYSHRVFIDEQNLVTRYWILPAHHSWMMERWDYIPQETCFWRRRLYEKVGGIDTSFQFALDYDLFVRFMRAGRMERVNRFLGAFREHPSSKTTQQQGAHPEVERVYQEHGIHRADWHRLPQLAQFELLDLRSRKFSANGKILPGALAGIGYDYDQVWGGRLNGQRSFSRSSSDTRRI
jgi:glycosyltransferase involved in cell wall biosynthesis